MPAPPSPGTAPNRLHAPAVPQPGAPLGELLRSARERHGITLQQISAETKFSLHHLEALERGDLAALPGGLYRRAHVRAYARAVHLDEHAALAQLEHVLHDAGITAAHASAPEPRAHSRRTITPVLVAGLVIVALALGFAARWRQTTAPLPPPSQTPTPARTLADAPAPTSSPLPASDVPVETTGSAEQDAAPAHVEGRAELVITSDPAGARVTVDGIGWGSTPLVIRHLPPGTKRIRVTKEGYRSEERVAGGSDGGTVHVTLENAAH